MKVRKKAWSMEGSAGKIALHGIFTFRYSYATVNPKRY